MTSILNQFFHTSYLLIILKRDFSSLPNLVFFSVFRDPAVKCGPFSCPRTQEIIQIPHTQPMPKNGRPIPKLPPETMPPKYPLRLKIKNFSLTK